MGMFFRPIDPAEITVSVLWAGHFRSVLNVATQAAQWPASYRDLDQLVPSVSGVIAERHRSRGVCDAIGYGFYEHLDARRTEVRTIVVHPRFRRVEVGTKIMAHIFTQARLAGRREIVATVPEHSEGAIRFLVACGLRAFRVERDRIKGPDGSVMDGYRFKRDLVPTREPETCMGR